MTTPGDARPDAPRGGGAGPVLLLLALLVAGGGFLAFYYLEHEPLREEARAAHRRLARAERAHGRVVRRVSALEAERERLQRRVAELRASEAELRGERDRIARERDALRAGNQEAQAALAAMQEAQAALRERLAGELASGEAVLHDDGDAVSVALDERVLFPAGASELNERGREVLRRVAASLATLPDRIVRVEGHTDSTPITGESASRFATNWELSTARATTVVRFFESEGVAPERLSAAGYGQHRPVASNSTAAGRRRNRRIEIALVRAAASARRE